MTDKLAGVMEKMLLAPEELIELAYRMTAVLECPPEQVVGDLREVARAQQTRDFNTPITIEGKECPYCKSGRFHRSCKDGKLPDKTKTFWEWAKLGMESAK